MAYLNVKDRIIETKIVYYGAGLSGKTTNLEMVKRLSTEGRAGEMMTLDTDGDRTLFFDWLPYNIGKFNGCDVKMQLYTVPGQAKYAETRRRVLASADGVVLVLDSQSGALERNKQTLADLRDHMSSNKLTWGALPVVVQLNKRDLPTAMDPKELMDAMALAELPFVPAVAARGEGVFETLREAARLVLHQVRDAARERSPELKSGAESELDGRTLYAQITDGAPLPAPSRKSSNGHAPSPATSPEGGAGVAVPRHASPKVAHTNGSAAAHAHRDDVAALPTTQLNELVVAHRTVIRRLDAVEQAMQNAVNTNVAEMERRLVARLAAAAEREHATREEREAAREKREQATREERDAAREKREQAAREELDLLWARRDETLQKALGAQLVAVQALARKVDDAARAPSSLSAELKACSDKLDDGLKQTGGAQAATQQAKGEVLQSVAALGKKVDADVAKIDASIAKRLEGEAVKGDAARLELVKRLEAALSSTLREIEGAAVAGEQRLAKKIEDRATAGDPDLRAAVDGLTEHMQTIEGRVGELITRMNELAEEARQSKKSWWR